MGMPDSQRYPWNLYLINNMDDIVVSPGSIHKINLCVPAVKNNMGTFVNSALHSLQGGSLEITLTVTLNLTKCL